MPICPQCSATIHAGADDQCPACGYSLRRADAVFGDGLVGFRRVEDAAGVLTHQERQELLHFLADLERNIPPAALCIYITDYGQTAGFRPHAHWILNHAQIHHPSFGRREKQMAIEDAELDVRIKSEEPAQPDAAAPLPQGNWFTRAAGRVRAFLRDALHPNLPPPVRQDWMLVLVLDVQLETACFSWGYQLDPYIDPNSINRCIVKAKLQFRERAMVAGLRRVMKGAVKEIAAGSRKVNARLRRLAATRAPHLLVAALGASLMLGGLPRAWGVPAASAPAAQAIADDDVAEEVPAEASTPKPDDAPPAPAPDVRPGAAASYGHAARWHEADQRRILAGEMPEAYNMLLPPAGTKRAAAPFRPGKARADRRGMQAQYSSEYRKASAAGLSDPQGLLGAEATRDVEHVLRELNANGRYRIYVAVVRCEQELPQELAVQTLVTATAAPCEYAALIRFPLGEAEQLDIGYQLVKLADEERHARLAEVRQHAAETGGDGLDALLAAIRRVDAQLRPQAESFTPITPETTGKLPLVELDLKVEEKAEELSGRKKLELFIKDPANYGLLYGIGATILGIVAVLAVFMLRRRSGQLLESVPDVRLSSPYGAGVSRHVRYLEGKESPKEKSLY